MADKITLALCFANNWLKAHNTGFFNDGNSFFTFIGIIKDNFDNNTQGSIHLPLFHRRD
jgi:hypothetical protein